MRGALNGALNAEEKARDLRRMKMLATGLLAVAATVIFLLARWGEAVGGARVGRLRAGRRRGRHGRRAGRLVRRHRAVPDPLGLPIPHTAIIQRKKDQLG